MDHTEVKQPTETPFKDENFKLYLVDLQLPLCKWFEKHFKDFPNVHVVNDRFENLPEFDCMVSAGNR
jgi:hypothetical protein